MSNPARFNDLQQKPHHQRFYSVDTRIRIRLIIPSSTAWTPSETCHSFFFRGRAASEGLRQSTSRPRLLLATITIPGPK